jgi:hypothetical protein
MHLPSSQAVDFVQYDKPSPIQMASIPLTLYTLLHQLLRYGPCLHAHIYRTCRLWTMCSMTSLPPYRWPPSR